MGAVVPQQEVGGPAGRSRPVGSRIPPAARAAGPSKPCFAIDLRTLILGHGLAEACATRAATKLVASRRAVLQEGGARRPHRGRRRGPARSDGLSRCRRSNRQAERRARGDRPRSGLQGRGAALAYLAILQASGVNAAGSAF